MVNILQSFKYFKTNFPSGGLIEPPVAKGEIDYMVLPTRFLAPRRIDSRDMCLSSSNQFQTQHCAGYTVAGYIEYWNWKTKHYPEQVNGDLIYFAAKQIDGRSSDGTTLKAAINGAMHLKLVSGTPKIVQYASLDAAELSVQEKRITAIKFALHEYGVCVSGFRITDEWDWVDKKTGIIRDLGDQAQSRGGHAVLICGYDDNGIYIQNSWGSNWGHQGFAILGWEQFNRQFMMAMIVENACF